MNEARFFGARDDLRLDAGFALDGGQKFAAVFGLAHGARGRRENFFDLMRLGQPAEARKRLQRGGHRLGGQRLAVEAARSEAHHFLFAIDDFEGQIGADPHHDHVNRIGTAVDRRYPHLFDWKRVVAVIQTSYNGGDRSDGAAHSPPHPSMNTSTSRDRLWRKRLNELSAVWPDFVSGRTDWPAQDPRGVAPHSRGAADRRRAAPPAKVKKLNKKMRALTRSLGPIRELDVELDILDDKSKTEGVSRPRDRNGAPRSGVAAAGVARRARGQRARRRSQEAAQEARARRRTARRAAGRGQREERQESRRRTASSRRSGEACSRRG